MLNFDITREMRVSGAIILYEGGFRSLETFHKIFMLVLNHVETEEVLGTMLNHGCICRRGERGGDELEEAKRVSVSDEVTITGLTR